MSNTAELLKGAAELFPDEVVTQAHVRHLDLPQRAGRFALITLDNGLDHTKPTTFGPQSLANLDTAIDQVAKEAQDGEIVGVGITGKPFIFAVGADLKGVEILKRHEDALAIGKGGHDVFKRLADLAVPTFAYGCLRYAVALPSLASVLNILPAVTVSPLSRSASAYENSNAASSVPWSSAGSRIARSKSATASLLRPALSCFQPRRNSMMARLRRAAGPTSGDCADSCTAASSLSTAPSRSSAAVSGAHSV